MLQDLGAKHCRRGSEPKETGTVCSREVCSERWRERDMSTGHHKVVGLSEEGKVAQMTGR